MSAWCPTTPFEEEVLASQPDHNYIYGDLAAQESRRNAYYQTRPREHLDYLERQQKSNKDAEISDGRGTLNVIRMVHKIAGTKQMGMDASYEDWDTQENASRETTAMIRHFGMGPSVDLPLSKTLTLPTLPIEKQSYVTQHGRKLFPVLLDNDSFRIVSTRMRNADAVKALQDSLDDGFSSNNDSSKTENIKPLLCEEAEFESAEEVEARELKEFHEEYPTLEQQKIKSTKRKEYKQAPENWANWRSRSYAPTREPENWRIRSNDINASSNNWREREKSQSSASLSYSSAANMSNNSDSSFVSLNNTSSSDEYASAKEYLDNSYNSNKQSSFGTKESPLSYGNHYPNLNAKRFYKPKDVYNFKNRNQQRQMF